MEDIRIENFRNVVAEQIKKGSIIMHHDFQLVRTPAYDKFNGINISSEMSFLIKEAGRICEYYASDIFYDLKEIHRDLMDEPVLFTKDSYQFVLGLRGMGVDGEYFMMNRLEQCEAEKAYRKIYAIEAHHLDGSMFSISLVSLDIQLLQKAYSDSI